MKNKINRNLIFILLIAVVCSITIYPVLHPRRVDIGDAYYRLFVWVFWGVFIVNSFMTSLPHYIKTKRRDKINESIKVSIVIILIVGFGTIKSQLDNAEHIKKNSVFRDDEKLR